MPFDALPSESTETIETYRARREAAARLWRGVPRRRFRMEVWQCESAACALGWLANRGHDGWRWYGHSVPTRLGDFGSFAAARYFGLSDDDASVRFNRYGSTYLWWWQRATSGRVAATLLSLPYVTWEDGRGTISE